MSDSLRPHGLQPTRLLCPWDSPGKNTGVGCHALFKWTQALLCLLCLLYWHTGSLPAEPPGKPNIYDSLCCTLETNTVLYINYISIKFFKNRKVSLCISSVPVCVCVDRQGQVSKISAAARCGDQKHWTKRQESWYFSQVIALAKLFSFSKSVSSKGK